MPGTTEIPETPEIIFPGLPCAGCGIETDPADGVFCPACQESLDAAACQG